MLQSVKTQRILYFLFLNTFHLCTPDDVSVYLHVERGSLSWLVVLIRFYNLLYWEPVPARQDRRCPVRTGSTFLISLVLRPFSVIYLWCEIISFTNSQRKLKCVSCLYSSVIKILHSLTPAAADSAGGTCDADRLIQEFNVALYCKGTTWQWQNSE